MMIKKISTFLILFFSTCSGCLADEPYGFKGAINILYNDVGVFRKSIASAPIIGGGREDYALRIGCLGMDDCTRKIPNIYQLLSTRKPISKACENPIYASIEIQFAASTYDSDRADEKYQIDYSGKCLLFNDKYFKLNKSLFDFFYTKPISSW